MIKKIINKKNLITILSLLILISCTHLDSMQMPTFESFQREIKEYQKGTEGLTINFVSQLTPNEISENSFVDIIFELQNKGFSDITEGIYKIITEEEYLRIEKKSGTILLKGKSPYFPEGEIKRIRITGKTNPIDKNLKEMPIKTTFFSCYGYKTILAESLCIDSDIEGIRKNKACTMREISFSGQGAPVAITKIIPKTNIREKGTYIEFEIFLENKGEGQAISENYIERACGAKQIERGTDYDKAKITAELSNKRLNCEPSQFIIKKGKETRIVCTQETPLQKIDAYTAPINIEINYGYLTSSTADLKIIKRTN
jgi:hypothetical protein